MRKVFALILAVLMFMLCMAGCTNNSATTDPTSSTESENTETDSAYVINNGKLVVGITEFAPMDYQDEGSSEWIGFDADLAKAFAKDLGVDVEFVVINWSNKEFELESKSIDCVWNGMTLTDGVKAAMETTNAYCKNAQVVIIQKDKAADYSSIEDMKDLSFAAEGGSAGEEALNDLGYNVTPVEAQSDAVKEVAAGTSDAAVIDLLMAGAMIGEGTSYENLTFSFELTSEEYGVGFRKGSDLADKLNEFFVKAYSDGTMENLAKQYSISSENIIEQK